MIGVVVLGVLGSGLWELVKPLLGWSWSGLLTIATLGLDSLRDGIYADAASSVGRPIGLRLAVQLLAALILVTGVAIIGYIKVSFRPQATRIARGYYFGLFFMAVVFTVASSSTAYTVQLASNYTMLETIVAPYVSDIDMKKLRSDYVQIKGRSQYVEHISKLQKLIRDNGGRPPVREYF